MPLPAASRSCFSTRFHYGTTSYRLLIDCAYWHASEWEYGMIMKGHHPVELGMFPFRTEEDPD